MNRKFIRLVSVIVLMLSVLTPMSASATSETSGTFNTTLARMCDGNLSGSTSGIAPSGNVLTIRLHNLSDSWNDTYEVSFGSSFEVAVDHHGFDKAVVSGTFNGTVRTVTLDFLGDCGTQVSGTIQVEATGGEEPVLPEGRVCLVIRGMGMDGYFEHDSAQAAIDAGDARIDAEGKFVLTINGNLITCQPDDKTKTEPFKVENCVTGKVTEGTITKTSVATLVVINPDGYVTAWEYGLFEETGRDSTERLMTANELAKCDDGEEPEPGAWAVINPVLVCVPGGVDVTFTVSGSENVPDDGVSVDVQVHPVPSEGGVPTASEFGTITQDDPGPYTVEVRSEDLSSGTFRVRVFKVGTNDFVESETTVTCVADNGEEPAPSPTPATPPVTTPVPTETPVTPAPTEVPTQEPTEEPAAPGPAQPTTPPTSNGNGATTDGATTLPSTGTGQAAERNAMLLYAAAALFAFGVRGLWNGRRTA